MRQAAGQAAEIEAGDAAEATRPGSLEAARERLIVALDVRSAAEARDLLDRLEGQCRWLKVGMELFYAEGRGIVSALRDQGFFVFLDLKLHDIPNTVRSAVRSLASLEAELLTVHTAGGPAMLQAAQQTADEWAEEAAHAPGLLGVTVLTSLDEAELRATGIAASSAEQVRRLAKLAHAARLRGLVCSPLELKAVRETVGPEMTLVTPGVRPRGSATNDQSRVSTPAEAIRDGASMLVVGRPITQAKEPARAAEAILREMASAL